MPPDVVGPRKQAILSCNVIPGRCGKLALFRLAFPSNVASESALPASFTSAHPQRVTARRWTEGCKTSCSCCACLLYLVRPCYSGLRGT